MPAAVGSGDCVFEDWAYDGYSLSRALRASRQVYDQRIPPKANHGSREHSGGCLLLSRASHRLRHTRHQTVRDLHGCFWRDISRSQPRAAGREDDIESVAIRPGTKRGRDALDIVRHDCLLDDLPIRLKPILNRSPADILHDAARYTIANGQDTDS